MSAYPVRGKFEGRQLDWLIIYLIYVLIIAAQGGVVFVTARFIRRRAGGQSWQSKIVAMVASYVGWFAVTIGGLLLLGVASGFMPNLILILILWFTATIASLIYLIVWLCRGRGAAG